MFDASMDYERRALNLLEAGQLRSAIVMSNLAIASAIRESKDRNVISK